MGGEGRGGAKDGVNEWDVEMRAEGSNGEVRGGGD